MKTTQSILSKSLIATALLAAFAVPVFAQTTGSEVQRDVNQQQRIEQGLKSGELSTKEAAGLEKGEAKVDHMESNALKNGSESPAEKARIQAAQNRESRAISKDDHNAQTGNPNSVSSKRMQADVQRNVNQEKRIEGGVQSGTLTNRETGALERGQAHVDKREAVAGANGHVSRGEQARIQRTENRQSRHIHAKKNNDRIS